uniref:Uncharacterized protein n=1 Tax=Globodera rostochiensis TaxID=31243 RepID=A0A914HCG1_GLORO
MTGAALSGPVFLATEFRYKNLTVWCRAVLGRKFGSDGVNLGADKMIDQAKVRASTKSEKIEEEIWMEFQTENLISRDYAII